MPRPDAAELIASKLDRIPLPDGREYRLMHFSTFGQSEDVKKRIEAVSLEISEGIVHLLESHSFTISHPSDPEPEVSAGKRIAALICPECGEAIARMPLDENDQLTPNLEALQSMVQIGGHPCLSNPR
jgi:hypothetical protein